LYLSGDARKSSSLDSQICPKEVSKKREQPLAKDLPESAKRENGYSRHFTLMKSSSISDSHFRKAFVAESDNLSF
jgi:hypothetical protein